MTRSLRITSFILLLFGLITGGWGAGDATVSAQARLRRAPERDLESTPLLPSGTRVLPAGTIIILEMETRLASDSSRISDRFRAHVAAPVADEGGRTIIPAGIVVEGHVSGVSKAKWAHRSGIIAIVFDNFRSPDGRIQPVRATLTSSDSADRKRLDEEEGYIKGGNPTRRDIVFIGGGAGLGAGIGVITGGVLVGGAIGAAAGLTTTLLLKGKDAVIRPGDRFGMELVQQFSLTNNPFGIRSVTPIPVPAGGPIPVTPYRPRSTGPLPGPLNPVDVTAERAQDGTVRLRVNAETPTTGWRVYTHHEVSGSLAKVRLRGTPPSRSVYDTYNQQSSITPAPEICLNDRNGTLRQAEILGKNGVVWITVDIPSRPGTSFARAQYRPSTSSGGYTGGSSGGSPSGGYSGSYPGSYPPNYNPETGRPTPTPIPVQPGGTSSSLSTLSQSAVNQVEVIRSQYAPSIGYFLEANGNYRFIGQRQPTQDQRQLLDNLGALLNSLRELRTNISNPYTRRNNALRVQEDVRSTQQTWLRVPLDASLNGKWNAAYRDITTLVNEAQR